MEKRWKILAADEEKVLQLQHELRISKTICRILVQRKIDTFDKAHYFFRPELSHLHDPWLMKDMLKAVSPYYRSHKKPRENSSIGDYDVDGTTAVACMYQFLKSIYSEVALLYSPSFTGKAMASRRRE
jgi:single-stranded-DNA-specific exonuclease